MVKTVTGSETTADDGRAMPSGFMRTPVGIIPDDWTYRALGELTRKDAPICYGIVQPGSHVAGGVPVLAIKDLNTDYDASVHRTSHIIEKRYKRSRVVPGDVLVSVKGTIGRVGQAPEQFYGNISRDLARLRFNNDQVPRFWLQMLKSSLAQRAINTAVVGTTRQELSIGVLKEIPLPFPLKDEQVMIADTLEAADSFISALDKLIQKKRAMKLGAMQRLFTGATRLPGFNAPWERKRIGEFTGCVAGGTPSTTVPEYWNGDVRWMTSGELNLKVVRDVEGRITREGVSHSAAQLLPANCVLVGLAGQGKTRGTVAINLVPLTTNQSVAAVLPDARFNPRFLYYNLDMRYEEVRGMSTGAAGRGGLNLSIIKTISVPFPEVEEQDAIAAVLSDMDSEIDALMFRRAKVRDIKFAMMQSLLSGRVRLNAGARPV